MISFVIPAYNEEKIIGRTIVSIKQYAPDEEYEIIVSDNSSTDGTASLSASLGAKVVNSTDKTISGVRNTGVYASSGEILIFLDADVQLTPGWKNKIVQTLANIRKEPAQISGSRCKPPSDGFWINTYWFDLATSGKVNYINSGHLITSRKVFNLIDGFDENLKTAEDHDFCQRAKSHSISISPDQDLLVIHDGYPKSLGQFIQRERWHGREDFYNFKTIINSKVAVLTILYFLLLFAMLFCTLFTMSIYPILAYSSLCFLVCTFLTILKFKPKKVKTLLYNAVIHYFYFMGRSLALCDRVLGRYSNRIREEN